MQMMKKRSLFLISVLAIAALVAGGCAAAAPEEEGTEPEEVLLTPEDALDVAVGWLQNEYPDKAPQSGTSWQVEDVEMTGPGGEPLLGASAKRIVSKDWEAMVTWQVVAPEHMEYHITLKSPTLGWYWQGTVKGLSGTITEQTPMQQMDEEMAKEVAEDFVRHSPTFVFDGIEETLTLTNTAAFTRKAISPQAPPRDEVKGWEFTFEFDSRHAGYGDRSGQAVAEVITPHTAVVTVSAMEITSAVMDGRWDMLAQEML
jgi:hypothetical protein